MKLNLPFSKKTQIIVGASILGALMLIGVVAGDLAVKSRLAAAQAVASVARAQMKVAEKQANEASAIAAAYQDSAAKAQKLAGKAHASADSAQHAADKLRGALAQALSVVPDTCKPIVITADSALAADSVALSNLHAVVQADSVSMADQAHAADSLRAALTRVNAASKFVVQADQKLSKAAKTPFLLRILPHPQLSIQEGVDRQGKFHTTLGIGAGYSF